MKKELTKQDILELFADQAKQIDNQAKNFENLLLKEREEREKSRIEFEKNLEQERKERALSRLEFDKRLGELSGTWGKFVAEMVKPRIVEMFKDRGIKIETAFQNIFGFLGDQQYYEIDLLLINKEYAVAVEVKSSLSVEDVKEHLERLDKIKKVAPRRIDLSNISLYGAVAGMIIEEGADRYAYRKGLFVLRQKGNIVEIANDEKFMPKIWKTEY
jgi:PII-like signaling protein